MFTTDYKNLRMVFQLNRENKIAGKNAYLKIAKIIEGVSN